MKDYSDIGLTSNLQSQDSLAVKPQDQQISVYNLAQDIFNEINPNIRAETQLQSGFFVHIGTQNFETYYLGGQMTANQSLSSAAFTLNILRAAPFISVKGGLIDNIATRVFGTVAGAECRLGIYQATSNTNLYPNNLILDAGTINTSTPGVKKITTSTNLLPNTLYWFAHIGGGSAAGTYTAISNDDALNILGVGTSFLGADSGIMVGLTYGTLPTIFPSNGTIISSNVPGVGVRFLK